MNPTRGRPTENTQAYALFLRARASLNRWEIRDAIDLLRQAVELDPKFSEAYEMLAYAYWWSAGVFVTSAEGRKLVGEAAANALAINPDLVFAQALHVYGSLETYSFLRVIEAFERAAREQPGKTEVLDALVYDLLEAGYLRDGLRLAERFVELDPLSPGANFFLADALYAVGRSSESLAARQVADQLDNEFATWMLGAVNLVEKQDDSAIMHFQTFFQQYDFADPTWARELVTGARDSETGQAYLERRILEIVASVPEDSAYFWRTNLTKWYLPFGFLDRYFEVILDPDSAWTGKDDLVYSGTIFRRVGFTAHPKYLEVAESLGFVDVWEQRGPPDFCEKVGDEWVCE